MERKKEILSSIEKAINLIDEEITERKANNYYVLLGFLEEMSRTLSDKHSKIMDFYEQDLHNQTIYFYEQDLHD